MSLVAPLCIFSSISISPPCPSLSDFLSPMCHVLIYPPSHFLPPVPCSSLTSSYPTSMIIRSSLCPPVTLPSVSCPTFFRVPTFSNISQSRLLLGPIPLSFIHYSPIFFCIIPSIFFPESLYQLHVMTLKSAFRTHPNLFLLGHLQKNRCACMSLLSVLVRFTVTDLPISTIKLFYCSVFLGIRSPTRLWTARGNARGP